MKNVGVIKGNIITAPELGKLNIIPNGYIVMEDGIVKEIGTELGEEYRSIPVEDYGNRLILHSFCDMHLHAPQYPMLGLGMDLMLMEWLQQYTFPLEAKFRDTGYAREIYRNLADALIHAGTTRVVMFSSLHTDSTIVLMDELEKAGITGYVGKLNMDRNSAPGLYQETTEESKNETLRFLKLSEQFQYIKPIITPRFAPSCTEDTLRFIGELAKEKGLYVQSHLSENDSEIAFVKELFPDCREYWNVYDKFGLFKDHTVMAHCIHSSPLERKVMRERNVLMVHCPNSNTNVLSGIAPLMTYLKEGNWVALGSDIAGGSDYHMNRAMTSAIRISKVYRMNSGYQERFLSVEEAYYLGTDAAAKYFVNSGDGITVGNPLHAIVVDDADLSPNCSLNLKERFERAIYLMDERNIKAVYSEGRKVVSD